MLGKRYRSSVRWAFNFHEWKPTSQEWTLATQCVQAEENERIHRFVFAEDSKASMIGQLLMRKAASEITGIPYNEVQFSRSETGKPFITSHSDILKNMNYNFNISHHGSMCVLAAGLGRRLGVDVMKVESRGGSRSVPEYFNLMQKQFSSEEWDFIMCPVTESEQLQRFFRLWCLKESYVKAKGTGISYNLRNLSFECKTSKLKECVVVTDTKLYVQGLLESNWLFEETMLNKNHCVAVAIERGLQEFSQHDDDAHEESLFSILSCEELMKNACPFVAPCDDFWKAFSEKPEKNH